MRSCAHDTEDDDLPVGPGEGLGLALPLLMTFEIFALMTFANEGVNTSSLLRDLLRVDMVGSEGMAWCTSNPERSLYVKLALGEVHPINGTVWVNNSPSGPPAR